MALFNQNRERFDNIGEALKGHKGNIIFQYNSNYGLKQVDAEFGDGSASDDIKFLIDKLKMTNIFKGDGSHMIYQCKPVEFSDIELGITFDYTKNKWRYYYNHNYGMCTHKNKLVYRLYDMIFNR
ncbi:MAG: hypothetical protein Q8865_09420 [Bacillota bacterium]|nr:hypothetical protein [Bacillota bacterium]